MRLAEYIADRWRYAPELFAIWGIAVVFLVLIVMVVWLSVREQQEWQEFAAAHECKVIARISPSSGVGVGFGPTSSGSVATVVTSVSIPGKTGYACNDGVTYWR